jgi:HD-like signal output (HDOD) protein
MEKLSILAQIKERDDLLSLPQALAEILRQVDDPDFGSEQLAKTILKDPPLTAKILKLANSATYSRFGRVSNVHQAVQTLGAVTVKCLALSSSVLHPERIEAETGIDTKVYFSNVLSVATACEKLAEAVGYIKGATDIVEAERMVFGTDHCEVGYHLAQRWRLPDYVVTAIRDHHGTEAGDTKNPIPGVVHLATLMVDQSAAGHEIDLETRLKLITEATGRLGLAKEQVDAVSMSVMSAAVSVAEYLKVDIGNTEDILTRANQEIWQTYFMVENLFKERQELTNKLLQQERSKGAYESKTIAMATLSHYLNNAAMAIYGRSQMIRLQHGKDDPHSLQEMLIPSLDVIDRAIKKMVAVLAEMKDISPIDEVEFLSTSKAMNMDERIERRIEQQEDESGLELPSEAEKLVKV